MLKSRIQNTIPYILNTELIYFAVTRISTLSPAVLLSPYFPVRHIHTARVPQRVMGNKPGGPIDADPTAEPAAAPTAVHVATAAAEGKTAAAASLHAGSTRRALSNEELKARGISRASQEVTRRLASGETGWSGTCRSRMATLSIPFDYLLVLCHLPLNLRISIYSVFISNLCYLSNRLSTFV